MPDREARMTKTVGAGAKRSGAKHGKGVSQHECCKAIHEYGPQLVEKFGGNEEESETGEVIMLTDVIGHSIQLNQRVEAFFHVTGHVG